MTEFQVIRFKNLLSYGNYFTEIYLNMHKTTLFVGTNGNGKSTLLDAICLALFNKPFRDVSKPALVNSINQKELLVEIEFKSNGKQYKVIRGIKPNIFEIFENGVLINQEASVKDYQEILEKQILGFNFKSFTQIVILGSASFKPFMKLTAADRRSVIDDLLDINVFSVMHTIIKSKLSTVKEQIATEKPKLDLLLQKYQMELKHQASMSSDKDQLIKQNQTEIFSADTMIQEITKKNELLNDQLQSLLNEYSKEQQKELEQTITKINRIEATVEDKISTFNKQLKFYSNNDTCPTCKQDLEESFKSSEIARLESEKNELQNGLQKLSSKLSSTKISLDAILKTQRTISEINQKISINQSDIRNLHSSIQRIRNTIESLEKSKNQKADKGILESIKKEILIAEENYKELLEEKEYLDTASDILKDNGIKTKIIKQYLPIINKLVNKNLRILNLGVNFTLDETFSETIKSRHRDNFVYSNFSEGEKSRINLALLFAWREVAKLKNSTNTNLLMLDEVFDSSLDDQGIEDLFNILNSLDDTNIFVISHKGDILEDKFERILEFKKKSNFSRMITL